MRRAWITPVSALMSVCGGLGIISQIALLRFEHRDVLQERRSDLVGDHVGGLAILHIEIVRLAPEVVAGALGLGGDGVEISHFDPADPPALGSPGAGRGCADVEPQECRRREVDDLPAVDVGREAARLHEGRRRRSIDDPAGDHDLVMGALQP